MSRPERCCSRAAGLSPPEPPLLPPPNGCSQWCAAKCLITGSLETRDRVAGCGVQQLLWCKYLSYSLDVPGDRAGKRRPRSAPRSRDRQLRHTTGYTRTCLPGCKNSEYTPHALRREGACWLENTSPGSSGRPGARLSPALFPSVCKAHNRCPRGTWGESQKPFMVSDSRICPPICS